MRLLKIPSFIFSTSIATLAILPRVVLGQSQGGSFCVSSKVLCVSAVVEGGIVTYQLTSTYGSGEIGWMAVGFGTGMLNSQLVVMWPNDDGTITLSQRQTSIRAMPQHVSNPTQIATIDLQHSDLKTDSTTIAFQQALPAITSDYSKVPMVWAVATSKPSGSASDATIEQHAAQGTFSMDLTGSVGSLSEGPYTATSNAASTTSASSQVTSNPTEAASGSSASSLDITPPERKLIRHGILMSVGTLILLPIGILIPRYTRTIPALQSKWLDAHAAVQLCLAGPIIFAGWALGYQFVRDSGVGHFQDTHTKVGLAFLILYCIQILWGITIHATRNRFSAEQGKTGSGYSTNLESPIMSSIKARLPQNYAHAIIGLTLIALALYNVHRGYSYEWQYVTGRNWTNDLDMVHHWWLAWVVIVPVAYVAGLSLLPRQWKQEYASRHPTASHIQVGLETNKHEF